MNTANGKGRLRIGVIGCGKITVTRHAPEYAANELCEVAGFFDYLPERAEAMASIAHPQFREELLKYAHDNFR